MKMEEMKFDYVTIQKKLKSLSHSSSFEKLFAHLKLSREISGYGRQETFSGRLNELQNELTELVEAHESSDLNHVSEEIGDVLWDVLFLFVLLEERGISVEKIVDERIEKQVRRLPYVYEGKIVSLEEEKKIWYARKKLEKEGKI